MSSREEDELARAIALSLSTADAEEARRKEQHRKPTSSGRQTATATASETPQARALYDFTARDASTELSFQRGDIIDLLDVSHPDWWRGVCRHKTGLFPANHVERIGGAGPIPLAVATAAPVKSQEDELQEIELLIAAMYQANVSEEALNETYSQLVATRPKLVTLIEKISRKNDTFVNLAGRLRNDAQKYDGLMQHAIAVQEASKQAQQAASIAAQYQAQHYPTSYASSTAPPYAGSYMPQYPHHAPPSGPPSHVAPPTWAGYPPPQ